MNHYREILCLSTTLVVSNGLNIDYILDTDDKGDNREILMIDILFLNILNDIQLEFSYLLYTFNSLIR
jgi:hypothetical protein